MKKIYLMIILSLFMIIIGLFIDNKNLTKENKQLTYNLQTYESMIYDQIEQIFRLRNDIDNCWNIYYSNVNNYE